MLMLNGFTGYQGQSATSYGAAIEVKGSGYDVWISVYNDTGGALSNGAIKLLSFKVASGVLRPVMIAPATETTESNLVAVVDNSIVGKASIADGEWGFAKVAGQVDSASVDGDSVDVAAGDQLEILNAGTAFTSAGVAEGLHLEAETCAIALEANTGAAAVKKVFLLGKQAQVKAS